VNLLNNFIRKIFLFYLEKMASSYNRLVSPIYQGPPSNANFTPEKLGSGCWWLLHTHAFEKSPFFPDLVKSTAKVFFCPEKCKPHFLSYLKNNPVPSNSNNWFDWTVDFHNDVNRRIGKPIVSRTQAYEMYSNPETCASCARDTSPQRMTTEPSRQSVTNDPSFVDGYAMPNSHSAKYRVLRR